VLEWDFALYENDLACGNAGQQLRPEMAKTRISSAEKVYFEWIFVTPCATLTPKSPKGLKEENDHIPFPTSAARRERRADL